MLKSGSISLRIDLANKKSVIYTLIFKNARFDKADKLIIALFSPLLIGREDYR